MIEFEFNYPVVHFDWQEESFIEGVIAFRSGLPNYKENLLDQDNHCVLNEAWVVGYRDAEEDDSESATCHHLCIIRPENTPKELFRMALKHTQNLQRKKKLRSIFNKA